MATQAREALPGRKELTKASGASTEELLARPDDLRRGYLAALERFNTQFEEIAQRNRCDLVQGYFTGRPIPAERFQLLLCENRARVSPDPTISEINSREVEQQALVVQ